jgi:glycosyltransferase involved in cell wall biosynthesis
VSTPTPRVALVGEQWVTQRPGGMNRYLAGLHGALRAAGADATAFVLQGDAPLPAGVVGCGPVDGSAPSRVARVRRAVRSSGPFDVVDVHFAAYAPGVVLAPRPRALVVHFHGPWADESAAVGAPAAVVAARRRIERLVYRRADRLVTLSAAFAGLLVDRYGVDPARVRVVPPGVDTGHFTGGGLEGRVSARGVLGVPADAFVVVCARRLVPRMGVDVLLDAWTAVADARPDAELVVVGDGPEAGVLRARADGVGGRVRFTGRVDETTLVAWYRAADLTVVPSVALEGFGLVVLESLACGRPVVVTDVGGLPAAAGALGTGLVVPAGDRRALAQVLAGAATGAVALPSPAACRAEAMRASWSAVAERHVALYDEVLR